MRDPGAVVAVVRFAFLVRAHFGERFFVRRRIVLHRNLRRHSAHRENVAPMTGLDAEQRIRAHEMRRHRDQRAIGEEEVGLVPKPFDAGKNVIPAAAVQPGGMFAQLVENFVHLKGGRDRLDQHRGADRALRNAELILRQLEDVVPDARFEMALHFRQVKIRAAAARDQLLRVVKKVESKIEKPAGDRLAIDEQVLLDQMPATRPNEQDRDLFVKPVFFPSGLVKVIVRRTASRRLIWPSIMFAQVGEFASSKSAMNIFAPELSALITILRSVGPVISTRRSRRSAESARMSSRLRGLSLSPAESRASRRDRAPPAVVGGGPGIPTAAR